MSKWKPMQGSFGERGDVLIEIWKSKKIAWHWIALYRSPHHKSKFGLHSTYGSISFDWNYKGNNYSLLAMEWLGFPRKLRWFRP